MSNEQKVSKTPKAPKVKFFDGVKAEFKKIIWPDKDTLLKQSVAVVFVSNDEYFAKFAVGIENLI